MPAHLLRRPSLVPAAHRLGVAAAAAWRAGGALSPPLARSSSSQRTCAPSTAGSTSAGSDTSTAETLRALARSRIAAAAPHPPLAPLEDRHARQHTYLRISLTERCNLRCTYCMPAEGLADLTPRAELLTPHELQRLATLFVRQGVDKIRLTGGEPTVRRDIVDVVARLASLRSEGLLQLGMTSNGMLLPRLLPSLAAAGLTHLNISLDTLDPHLFELITRRSGAGVARVLAAAEQSVKLGLTTKLNVVVVRGVNDSKDVLDFVEWARHRDIVVRFIEYMPFDGNKWRPEKLVPYRVLLERIVERFGPLEKVGDTANDTSKHWRVPGSRGTIGFITSMTDHFCGTCNRLRITADGNLKVCLFGNTEVSLRDAMRTGLPLELSGVAQTDGPASDEDLLHIVSAAVKRKHAKHAGMSAPEDLARSANRSMIRIGG